MNSITPEIVEQHGLKPDEYQKIVDLMGREPNITELGVFSVMWSEHCSYKSSRVHLKRLPTNGPRVIVPPGENAGVVDIGDDWCVAFKVESHNHPSFIEPFQGAATGVGGILRDVFTMGARPIAAMNSLRFGPLNSPPYKGGVAAASADGVVLSDAQAKVANRNKSILKGCVAGIGHYGNCFGVPTVGGEVVFDESYSLNPLVNAFALGLVRKDQIFFGKASGIGNPVLYAGAKTGRDGIHGATMASAEFDDEALEKRPTVQVGDPFLEKLLLEACLEAMRSGAIEGIQDMGAAGLTSSSVEMAARAGNGLELDLTLVPQRETGMTAYEMLLSESQERMLIVARKGHEKEVVEIFNKWDLDCVAIGKVVEGDRLKIVHNGELMADLPVMALTDEAPKYNRPMAPGSLISFVKAVGERPSSEKENFLIGIASDHNVEIVKTHTGLEIDGYERILSSDAVRHVLRQHSNQVSEDLRGQESVTERDFALIPGIVENPDSLKLEEKRGDLDVIGYAKKYNGVTYYFEEVRTGRRQLAVKTFYKKKSSAPPLANVQNASEADEPQRSNAGAEINDTTDVKPFAGVKDLSSALHSLLASPNICSKRWVYEQYDTMVRTNTAVLPGSDAAVIRIKETRRAVAMCLDGNGKYVAINPREGAKLAVAEAARNVVCVGAKPIAVTNCLNFASPERPEVMWSFSEVIDGMAEACNVFETPVVSGNVSFYNETDGRGILPTPVIGMVGLIDDTRKIVTHGFKDEGDIIAVLGTTRDDLASSEYAQTVLGRTTDEIIANGVFPAIDLDEEKLVQDTLLKLIDNCLIKSAHDCSDGGLAVTIAECGFSSLGRDAIGAEIDLVESGLSPASLLFGETPSRIVISFAANSSENVYALIGACPFAVIGKAIGTSLKIGVDGTVALDAPISDLEAAWSGSLRDRLESGS